MTLQNFMFSWLDYMLFILMLVFSGLIGIYYGFFQKQSSANEYLLGGKRMGMLPVAMSLVSSTLSGLALLAVPADMYRYGICYWLAVPMFSLVLLAAYKIYLPVFYKLQITSTYEYLNLRFNNRIRIMASVLFTIYNFLYLPIVIYVPALALSQVTGVNTHLITPLVCSVCIFYTTLGGIKAVVWTDALQFVNMLGSVCVVFFLGVVGVGGPAVIWDRNYQTGRLTINFDLDMTKRDSFWTGVIGIFPIWLTSAGIGQGCVQKCLSLPSFKHIKTALILYGAGTMIMVSISSFSGLLMYAEYYDCDPLESKQIASPDQLLPFYVMDVAKAIPGLAGLFISGIFSAALSTLSASMNCLAATVYEDFVSPFIPKNVSQNKISKILKGLVVTIGILCTALVFVVEQLGSLLALAISFSGITSGPLLGLFTVGMLIPMVNSKGALWGAISSLVIMTWIVLTSQWYKSKGIITYESLPVFTDGCNTTIGKDLSTVVQNKTLPIEPQEEAFVLYRISFYYFVLLGVIIVLVVSVTVSYFTEPDHTLNEDCISPVAQFLIKKTPNNKGNKENKCKSAGYNTLERAATLVIINKE